MYGCKIQKDYAKAQELSHNLACSLFSCLALKKPCLDDSFTQTRQQQVKLCSFLADATNLSSLKWGEQKRIFFHLVDWFWSNFWINSGVINNAPIIPKFQTKPRRAMLLVTGANNESEWSAFGWLSCGLMPDGFKHGNHYLVINTTRFSGKPNRVRRHIKYLLNFKPKDTHDRQLLFFAWNK